MKKSNSILRLRFFVLNATICLDPLGVCVGCYILYYYIIILYAHYLSCQTSLPLNQPTSLKVKNVHIFGVFQPIRLNFGMESLNGRTQHMYVIYLCLSMPTSQTHLPPNQLTGVKVKNLHKLDIFQPIWLKLGMESLNERPQHMHTIYPNQFTTQPPY